MQDDMSRGAQPGASEGGASKADLQEAHAAYWRKNRRLIAVLLGIWALVSYGLAILFPMTFPIGKLPAGFWWAQQGSMFVFVILIFVYARRMDRLDRAFDVDEKEGAGRGAEERVVDGLGRAELGGAEPGGAERGEGAGR